MFTASSSPLRLNANIAAGAFVAFSMMAGLGRTYLHGETAESAPSPSKRIVVEVFHLVGFNGAKPNARGLLSLSRDKLVFSSSKRSNDVFPYTITQLDIDHDSRALLPGKASIPIRFAPYQAGLLANPTPTADDVLTLDYRDARSGLHEAVFLLSRQVGSSFASYLSNFKYRQINFGDEAAAYKAISDSRAASYATQRCTTCTAIQLGRFENVSEAIPLSVRAMLYENLVAELRSSRHFDEVLRAGEKPTRPIANLITLNLSIQSFTKGGFADAGEVTSPAMRPHLEVSVQVTRSSGNVLLAKTVIATLTGRGEDLDVCETMSKKIVELLKKES